MYFAELLVAMAYGLFIVWIVSLVFDSRGPWGSLLWFFLVVVLFSWAGGVWLVPFGPHWRGIGWAPIIFMGFLVSLLLVSVSPRTYRKRIATEEQAATDSKRNAEIDAFFWILIICLLVFGIGHYAWYPRVG